MGILGWIFYIIMGIVCYLLILLLEKKYSINKKEKFVFSIIYLLVISGLCYRYVINYTSDIFLIFVFTFISDLLFTSYFLDYDFFDKRKGNISYYLLLIFIGFIINQEFINKVNQVFLTGEDLRVILWFLGIIFIYKFFDDRKIESNDMDNNMNDEYIIEQYAKLKYRYFNLCDSKNKDFSNLMYAIMIYNNHKRNKLLRRIDYFLFRLNGNNRKLGIMQVESDKYITDNESIEISRKRLEKICFKSNKSKVIKDISSVVMEYDKEGYQLIMYIFDIIKKL